MSDTPTDSAARPRRKYRQRRTGRNVNGLRVLAASCPCGWQHMTAYRLFRRRSPSVYLLRRYNVHPCEVTNA